MGKLTTDGTLLPIYLYLLQAKGAFHERKYECCEEKYQVLEITMKLKRARQFYQYVLVGPGVILALLVPLQFLLPPNTAQRSLFGKFAESVLLTVEPERECLVLRPDFFY